MNPKIKKAKDELERTKARIIELQALVPQLEKNITDMENADIIKAVRADVAPADLPAFIASIKHSAKNAAAVASIETHATGASEHPALNAAVISDRAEESATERENTGADGGLIAELTNKEEDRGNE